jgi:hypothetical protein
MANSTGAVPRSQLSVTCAGALMTSFWRLVWPSVCGWYASYFVADVEQVRCRHRPEAAEAGVAVVR